MTTPPEVLFDRFFRECGQPHARPYTGKQDLAALPVSQGSLLLMLQESLNEALRSEKRDVPEHVAHPPFHCDYIISDVPNALAFQYQGYSFIGITMALIYLLWDICNRMSQAQKIAGVIGITLQKDQWEPLHIVLFRIQVFFVVAHEYTHHVHGHLSELFFSHEILQASNSGTLQQQALEADADGYSAYHVLTHLIGGEGRSHAVELLKISQLPVGLQDRVLFSCFIAATAAYLFVRPPQTLDSFTVYTFTHPPQAARMNCLMQQSMKWCEQNREALKDWTTLTEFQKIMQAVEEVTWGMNGGKSWAEQTAFLQSDEGAEYLTRLQEALKSHVQSL